jgi:ethanolamine utilization protein EutN
MYLARVLGPVVTPVQHPFFAGRKLLLVRKVELDGRANGPDRIAVDRAQAGAGDLVLVLEEGNSARQLLEAPDGPVRSVIVGFVDQVEVGGSVVLDPESAQGGDAP